MAKPIVSDARDGEWTARQRLKNDVIFALAEALLLVLAELPRRAVEAFCSLLAIVAWLAMPCERRLCRARLEAATGGPVATGRVRGVFRTAGATLADTLALLDPTEPAGRTLTVDDASREVFRSALAEGRGVVFVSAHLGSWERLAALMAAEGFPCASVARESYDARFTKLYDRLREPRGVRSIYRGRPGAVATIVRELRAGRAVGFLVDLPSRVPSAEAEVLGAPWPIPVGPARIALAHGAVVIFGAVAPRRGERPAVEIERIDTTDLEPGSAGQRALVDRIAATLDRRIRAAPEAWVGLLARPRDR